MNATPMNATILGCGYVGTAVARRWVAQGLHVTATTTRPERVEPLQAVADRVQVVTGSNLPGLVDLLHNQAVLLICVGAG
ncbi:MAG TPA: NAD(P)-binding domain-containing protein, partial [Nodosilinea sp.]|nr:NAD(P)-binding domain-containing protein [Nodosilinea sp.]